jgi:hypothetical protein
MASFSVATVMTPENLGNIFPLWAFGEIQDSAAFDWSSMPSMGVLSSNWAIRFGSAIPFCHGELIQCMD